MEVRTLGCGQVGHPPIVDVMGVDDYAAACRLTEHLRQPNRRHRIGGDKIPQHLPRSYRGQLVDITHDQQP
jgi:hypothetical protein